MPSRTKHRSIQVPAKIGRPTKYSPEWAEGFCALIAEGQSVAEICERCDQPSQQSVYTWLRENEDFLERYARAREAQADKLFKECLEIADRGSEGENENPQRIQRDRLRIDTRKWMAARLAPKKYGDQISHDVKGGTNINFQPQILIQCSSAGEDDGFIDVRATSEAAGTLPQQGNGNLVRGSGGRR
jgi:Bacteriophage Sf6, terminase small subunit-like